MGALIFFGILAILVLIAILKTAIVVPQKTVYIVERAAVLAEPLDDVDRLLRDDDRRLQDGDENDDGQNAEEYECTHFFVFLRDARPIPRIAHIIPNSTALGLAD